MTGGIPNANGGVPKTPAKSLRPRLLGLGRGLLSSSFSGLWLALVAFPIVIMRFDATARSIDFLWERLPRLVAVCVAGAIAFRFLLRHKAMGAFRERLSLGASSPKGDPRGRLGRLYDGLSGGRARIPLAIALGLLLLCLPFRSNPYSVSIYTTALIYITLGLGLNIVVGVSGLLNLGYVAFYAIGAYTYALLNTHFGLGFWVCLPLGALAATLLGFLLGLPILRVSGDYLAIVTLGFAEIVRLVLDNLKFTNGPRGIPHIAHPGFFGLDLDKSVKPFLVGRGLLHPNTDLDQVLLYFIVLAVVALTVVCVHRLENSRLGRAWLALREDEVACQAMGVSRWRAKLTAFTLGSTWAGLAGVIFASQITFINPKSFSFMLSVIILSIVVLGGMGSIPGVILGAIVLILAPEYLRFFDDYRMLLFGLIMVLMMVFRPEGIIKATRKVREYKRHADGESGEGAPEEGAPEGAPAR
jgi:branched-chain amino acid transport system permease protein